MIELPEIPAPNGAEPALLDFGQTVQPPLGGPELRIDKLGNRYRIAVSWPPMPADRARVFISRLQRAKSDGLRIPYPLLVTQGSPGPVVVDGAAQSGTTINLRGFVRGYTLKEGYWLSIQDASGQHYLHNATATLKVGADGLLSLPIWPMLREPFEDGATVHIAKPMIEGLPEGDETSWALPTNHLIELSVAIRETK